MINLPITTKQENSSNSQIADIPECKYIGMVDSNVWPVGEKHPITVDACAIPISLEVMGYNCAGTST